MKIMLDGAKYNIGIYNKNTNDVVYDTTFEAKAPLHFTVKKYVGKKTKILFAISGVCHWESEYVFEHTKLPSHCRIFYEVFKSEFLKGNFIDLAGEKNYSFYLMYDLIKNPICDKETHLLNLMINYPEVTNYCEELMGKYGYESRTHKGKKYIHYCRNIYVRKVDFPDKQLILDWLSSDFFRPSNGLSIYVDETGIIDAIKDKNSTYTQGCSVFPFGGSLPEFIKFGKIEGSFIFTNHIWSSKKHYESGYQGGEMSIESVTSLNGSPSIVNGDFICNNVKLQSLIGGPKEVTGDFICKNNLLSDFTGMPRYIGGCFNFSNNDFTDEAWEYCRDNIEGEFCNYMHRGNKFIKYHKKLF